MSLLPVVLVGNPDNRRVVDFARALSRAGHAPPRIVAHASLIEDPSRLLSLPDEPAWVRIDSVGESSEVDRLLWRAGRAEAEQLNVEVVSERELERDPPARGRLLAPRQHYLGLTRYLIALDAVLRERPRWRVLTPPSSVIELFDKRRCWERHREAGIPVPDALPPTRDVDALLEALRERGWSAAYVKLTSGSSASGLAVVRWAHGRPVVMTTMRRTRAGWFNSLRLQRAEGALAREALAYLLREGAHVERSVPKARFERRFCDLRVLLVEGEPAFVVLRTSTHPITNLHLGGRRGDAERFLAELPGASWTRAMQTCRRAAQLFSCFHLGLDVLFEPDLERHRVLEANAFGDLLPGTAPDGVDVYGYQADRLGARVLPARIRVLGAT
ncbi:MAG TPA: STM4014 family protein [Sandaracinaceae bacterium]